MELDSPSNVANALFVSMVHAKLRQEEVARRWYDKAVAWMEENELDERQLERFLAEAFGLLSAADELEDEEALLPKNTGVLQ